MNNVNHWRSVTITDHHGPSMAKNLPVVGVVPKMNCIVSVIGYPLICTIVPVHLEILVKRMFLSIIAKKTEEIADSILVHLLGRRIHQQCDRPPQLSQQNKKVMTSVTVNWSHICTGKHTALIESLLMRYLLSPTSLCSHLITWN